jgi:hypothetical protein
VFRLKAKLNKDFSIKKEAFLFIKKERTGQINLAEELVFLTQRVAC